MLLAHVAEYCGKLEIERGVGGHSGGSLPATSKNDYFEDLKEDGCCGGKQALMEELDNVLC